MMTCVNRVGRWVRPDFLILTFLLFFTVASIGLITINISFFDPIEKALGDFNFSDLLYSKLASKQEQIDTNIVLVNIGHLNRSQIARQIERIRKYKPRVIGLDGFFSVRRDSLVDAELQRALTTPPAVVMACYLAGPKAVDLQFDSLEGSDPYFMGRSKALVNLGGANPETSTIRFFSPEQLFRKDTIRAMAAELVRQYDKGAFDRFAARQNEREIIRYIGNRDAFLTIDAAESLDSTTDLSVVNGKIVLLGYMGSSFSAVPDLEDIYFTPMNPELAGRSRPDMYGVVIHANAAGMILSGNYINEMPLWLCLLLSFFMCYFYVLFITWFDNRNHDLFEILFPVILLVINAVLIYLFFILYRSCNYSINSTWFLVPLILYEAFLKWYQRTHDMVGRRVRIPGVFTPSKRLL